MITEKGDTLVLVGTRKGLFGLVSSDRREWKLHQLGFEGVEVHRAILDPKDGRGVIAGVMSMHWGPSVHRASEADGAWHASSLSFPASSGISVARVWQLARDAEGALYAGVEPAGLFRSDDDGRTWHGVDALNAYPGREDWMPGGGGLCLHTILPHPTDALRMVVAISAVGVLETRDGGASWRLMNGGIRSEITGTGRTEEAETGSCPHKLVRDAADADLLYMQNHWGVYRRGAGDAAWTAIDGGLPSTFGFPMVAHPRKASTVYTVPLVGDFNRVTLDGALGIHRTRDGGASWTRLSKGLPQKDAWFTVLRDAMAIDGHDVAGLYVGTTTGELYASHDEGESWRGLALTLPPILSVAAGIVR